MDNDIKELKTIVTDFIQTYETDMRGDMKLGNGEKGIVNEIRDIKDHLKKYPSITFLIYSHPFKVLGTVFIVFLAMYFMAELAVSTTDIITLIRNALGL